MSPVLRPILQEIQPATEYRHEQEVFAEMQMQLRKRRLRARWHWFALRYKKAVAKMYGQRRALSASLRPKRLT